MTTMYVFPCPECNETVRAIRVRPGRDQVVCHQCHNVVTVSRRAAKADYEEYRLEYDARQRALQEQPEPEPVPDMTQYGWQEKIEKVED